MSYAGERVIVDADSHLIELDDFLHSVAREADLPLIPDMRKQEELPVVQRGLDRGRELFARRCREPELMARFEAALLDNTKSG